MRPFPVRNGGPVLAGNPPALLHLKWTCKGDAEMAKYLWEATYTADGIQGLRQEGGTGRQRAVEEVIESLGGTVEAFYYAFGSNDTYTVFELPDNVSAAAASLAITAGGAVRVRTTVLLDPEEVDEALQKSVEYRPPGQ